MSDYRKSQTLSSLTTNPILTGAAILTLAGFASRIIGFFYRIFLSQQIGCNKPQKAFFDACFATIPDFCREESLIVGDSLSSDILGGRNAGIATCWVNPDHKPGKPDIRPDYEIERLSQLETLLETI